MSNPERVPEIIYDKDLAEERLKSVIEDFRETPASTLETYVYFGLNNTPEASNERAEQKELFLNGETRNPKLNYPLLLDKSKVAELAQMEQAVVGFMLDSTEVGHNLDREEALYDILRIKRLEVGMIQISHELAIGSYDEVEKQEIAELFNRVNDEVHGKLEAPYFSGLLEKVRNDAIASKSIAYIPSSVEEAANYILDNSGQASYEAKVVAPIVVDQGKILQMQQFVQQQFADLIACVPERAGDEKLSIEELTEAFIKAHEARQTGWSVRTEVGKKVVDTRQSERATVVGSERKQPTPQEAQRLIVHENGVHVERRERGDRSGDVLLGGLGLPGYLDAEEGIAKVLEQCLEGKQTESGVQYYLSLGFARGLDGIKRDFRDVYELEWRRRVVGEYLAKSSMDDERIAKLQSLAYETCVRIFRGTPCDIPGMVYTKDQAYFMGNQKMWEIMLHTLDLPEEDQPEFFDKLFAAKYDPTNPLHQRLVEAAL